MSKRQSWGKYDFHRKLQRSISQKHTNVPLSWKSKCTDISLVSEHLQRQMLSQCLKTYSHLPFRQMFVSAHISVSTDYYTVGGGLGTDKSCIKQSITKHKGVHYTALVGMLVFVITCTQTTVPSRLNCLSQHDILCRNPHNNTQFTHMLAVTILLTGESISSLSIRYGMSTFHFKYLTCWPGYCVLFFSNNNIPGRAALPLQG